jgi:hypothetical protein
MEEDDQPPWAKKEMALLLCMVPIVHSQQKNKKRCPRNIPGHINQ